LISAKVTSRKQISFEPENHAFVLFSGISICNFKFSEFLNVFIVLLSMKRFLYAFIIIIIFIVFLFTTKQMKIKEIHDAEMKQTSLF
jgi:hypothetical protein